MKKIILATSAIILGSAAAHASEGQINITGQITDRTCKVDNKTTQDYSVVLPTVSTSSLAAAGQTAGRTPFTINLTDCSEGKVATYFEPGSTVDYDSGRLKNVNGSAKNVQVQLLGDNNQVIQVLAGPQENSQEVSVAAGGSAALNYYAEYYAQAQTTAGTVDTSVKYTIIYP
ncbi:fimbrial protein [Psychrobacter sanguinis]|uniref:fimbrial protein n=1 Tax=Psychrobacter sanguinis TaxID=861445 RepID=UPI001918BBE6|nr:fimbrial protein [Psychrobacter sanguinis]MCC3345098.1 type 1 fimbrial protein [Psychrobacter sanguinis]